ncbi:MAG TPA: xanthine dehydrogenase family protein molybdopterin-binding subunit, partial [Ktedonobacterales bacterium]|nr:xanthine dehydrogenase family protein molybdopterin-binding subunit [Ktedonobacterales bacterium]
MAVTRLFGASVKRREDPRLITGRGSYTDDIKLPGMVYMAILRSPFGHARITRIDTTAARRHPGVHAVYTAEDIEGKVNPMPCVWLLPDSDIKNPDFPVLAKGTTRFTGDAVAAVVADDPYVAHDALDLIEVDYDSLPAVVDEVQAMQEGAPQL